MLKFSTIGPFLALIALATEGSAAPYEVGKEVVINEGRRPDGVWRAYSGQCGPHRYHIKIAPAPLSKSAIYELAVDGKKASLPGNFPTAIRGKSDLIDAAISRCEDGRALIRLDVADRAQNYKLDFYYFWITTTGVPSDLFQK